MSRSFMLAGTPVPDGRPKFARMGKFTRVYMPKKVTDYRTKLKVAYLKVYPRLASAGWCNLNRDQGGNASAFVALRDWQECRHY